MTGIYKIESKSHPRRCYIGSAVNITHRWNCHLNSLRKGKHCNYRLQDHYNRYGKDDLLFSVLIGCDKINLITNEQFFIDSFKPYFNILPIAGNWLGMNHTKETKKKLSESAKKRIGSKNPFFGKHHSEETKEKLRMQRIGIKHSEEYKQKMSLILKKRIFKDEWRISISKGLKGKKAWNKGIKLSEEQKSIIYTDEVRNKMNQDKKGKPLSEEHKEKLKQARALYELNKITTN